MQSGSSCASSALAAPGDPAGLPDPSAPAGFGLTVCGASGGLSTQGRLLQSRAPVAAALWAVLRASSSLALRFGAEGKRGGPYTGTSIRTTGSAASAS